MIFILLKWFELQFVWYILNAIKEVPFAKYSIIYLILEWKCIWLKLLQNQVKVPVLIVHNNGLGQILPKLKIHFNNFAYTCSHVA